jgi:hypothetical protein
MSQPPDYFLEIQQRAKGRWDQLEADPELGAPWQQLFRQVQSPRHVLSALLQNADDVGATEASVAIMGDRLTFCHNGRDFSRDDFASLCWFGWSNKRVLHPIGFRGIGSKSTFSLGNTVHLRTLTLSVAFHRKRFTLPEWMSHPFTTNGSTAVQVQIADEHRRSEIGKSLQEWSDHPVSLLFFCNLRCLRIVNKEFRWESLGPGPVQGTEWMACNGDLEQSVLLARSAEEPFPPEALKEIREERILGIDEEFYLPPCSVAIVLGAIGRVYSVLPTGCRGVSF